MSKSIDHLLFKGDRITQCGKGFLLEKPLEKNHPPVLHVQGTPYEMGYQHGFLLAGYGIPALSDVYYRCSGWDPDSGDTPAPHFLDTGRALLSYVSKTYFLETLKRKAPDMIAEMEGLVDGFGAAGVPFSFEDLLNWVSIFELGSQPELISKLIPEFESSLNQTDIKRCTGIAVWDKATRGGYLIHGANQDIDTFGILHQHSIVMVANLQSL